MAFDLFDDLVSHEFDPSIRRAQQTAALDRACSEANRLFGSFLRAAGTDDEFESRCMLIAADMQKIWDRYSIDARGQQLVVDHLKVSDSWENPAHESDNCCTPDPEENPATSMPWGEAGPTPPQSGTEEENDATLRHVASWFNDDPVQGIDYGDLVAITNDAVDPMSGQQIQPGESGTVQDINGPDVTVDVNGRDLILQVQDLEKLGRVSSSQWAWDSNSNAFKSSQTSTFSCPCGRGFTGVGQHRCVCGKVWNMSAVINGSKTAQDFPVYSCREVKTDDRLLLADVQNNGTGNDPAKGGPGGNEDPPQPDLVMEPDRDSYVEPYNNNGKGAKVARLLEADAGLWPLLDDKDIQANWKALMGIILNPSQVGALEHEQYQGLIQDLYDEINRRGLNSPVDPNQPMDLMDPAQQIMQQKQPSPTALAYRRMGFNAAVAGVVPASDEPLECLQGWVLGLNQKIADSYQDRTTEYEGSEPAVPGVPIANDALDAGSNIPDPTPSQRVDLADDADDRNAVGQSDNETANHVDDLEPEGQKTASDFLFI